jgi:flagellar basal-body rod protein FlgB
MLNWWFNKELFMNTDPTLSLVSLALDASLMRQTAIANNIANINSVNYQTLEVNFEQQLQSNELSSIKPFYQPSEQPSTIDEQMSLNVANITHYRALIKGLNQKFAIMKLALQGNNAS